jgi:hypothetical protein
MASRRMKAYFIDFSFIQNPLLFVTNVTYDLNFMIMDISIIDVT